MKNKLALIVLLSLVLSGSARAVYHKGHLKNGEVQVANGRVFMSLIDEPLPAVILTLEAAMERFCSSNESFDIKDYRFNPILHPQTRNVTISVHMTNIPLRSALKMILSRTNFSVIELDYSKPDKPDAKCCLIVPKNRSYPAARIDHFLEGIEIGRGMFIDLYDVSFKDLFRFLGAVMKVKIVQPLHCAPAISLRTNDVPAEVVLKGIMTILELEVDWDQSTRILTLKSI